MSRSISTDDEDDDSDDDSDGSNDDALSTEIERDDDEDNDRTPVVSRENSNVQTKNRPTNLIAQWKSASKERYMKKTNKSSHHSDEKLVNRYQNHHMTHARNHDQKAASGLLKRRETVGACDTTNASSSSSFNTRISEQQQSTRSQFTAARPLNSITSFSSNALSAVSSECASAISSRHSEIELPTTTAQLQPSRPSDCTTIPATLTSSSSTPSILIAVGNTKNHRPLGIASSMRNGSPITSTRKQYLTSSSNAIANAPSNSSLNANPTNTSPTVTSATIFPVSTGNVVDETSGRKLDKIASPNDRSRTNLSAATTIDSNLERLQQSKPLPAPPASPPIVSDRRFCASVSNSYRKDLVAQMSPSDGSQSPLIIRKASTVSITPSVHSEASLVSSPTPRRKISATTKTGNSVNASRSFESADMQSSIKSDANKYAAADKSASKIFETFLKRSPDEKFNNNSNNSSDLSETRESFESRNEDRNLQMPLISSTPTPYSSYRLEASNSQQQPQQSKCDSTVKQQPLHESPPTETDASKSFFRSISTQQQHFDKNSPALPRPTSLVSNLGSNNYKQSHTNTFQTSPLRQQPTRWSSKTIAQNTQSNSSTSSSNSNTSSNTSGIGSNPSNNSSPSYTPHLLQDNDWSVVTSSRPLYSSYSPLTQLISQPPTKP
ncbi:unnamed protein product, partial [Anisakis simplex]|uniref:Protein kinase domain-containing protein n=1 Tax=Anisakis simplex TaxID=6269 RepID=A0A0M3J5P0_ANISI